METNNSQPRRVLRLPAVLHRVGLSRTRVYDKIARGEFPRQVKLGERASGWFDDEIDAWMAERAAARGGIPAEVAETV